MNVSSWIIGITMIRQFSFAYGNEVERYMVSSFKISDLENGKSDKEVREVLESSGLLAIRMKSNDNYNLKSLCDCHQKFDEIPGGNRIVLDDNLTTRSTIATATMGIDHYNVKKYPMFVIQMFIKKWKILEILYHKPHLITLFQLWIV